MKKIIVIGAGISGLVTAVYARRAGFDVTVFEKHFVPGGLSASWKRKDYVFEGGMHWLGGSIPKMPLHEVWTTAGAISDNNPLYFRDPFYTVFKTELSMYRDLDKTIESFLRHAPEDKKAIKKLQRDVKALNGIHTVLIDLPCLKVRTKHKMHFMEAIKMLPAAIRLPYLSKTPLQKYISMFKNKDIKALLNSVIGYRYNAYSLLYTISSFAQGDCAYPEGGSLRMAKNMADRLEQLGGKIEYNKEVSKIIVENGKAVGVVAKGETVFCDAVVCSCDLMAAEKLFDSESLPKKQKKIFEKVKSSIVPEMTMFLCYGVNADLSKYPKGIVIPLSDNEMFEAGGIKFTELRINNYAEYRDITPAGKTSVTCLLLGDSYNYWKNAKDDGTYKEKKENLSKKLLALLEEKIPEIKGNVEVTDVATPLTYERYTNAYHGSWMSVWSEKTKLNNYKEKSPVDFLYFTGERLTMTGGLPIAAASGFKAAQHICRDFKVEFV